MAAPRTTNSWFDVAQVLARQGDDWKEFRSRFADSAGIPLGRMRLTCEFFSPVRFEGERAGKTPSIEFLTVPGFPRRPSPRIAKVCDRLPEGLTRDLRPG